MQDRPYDRQLSYLLARAHRQVHGGLHAILKDKGIPVEQWRILQALSDGRGRAMGELAAAVLMNHPALTKTIDRMIMRALVHRRHDTADRSVDAARRPRPSVAAEYRSCGARCGPAHPRTWPLSRPC